MASRHSISRNLNPETLKTTIQSKIVSGRVKYLRQFIFIREALQLQYETFVETPEEMNRFNERVAIISQPLENHPIPLTKAQKNKLSVAETTKGESVDAEIGTSFKMETVTSQTINIQAAGKITHTSHDSNPDNEETLVSLKLKINAPIGEWVDSLLDSFESNPRFFEDVADKGKLSPSDLKELMEESCQFTAGKSEGSTAISFLFRKNDNPKGGYSLQVVRVDTESVIGGAVKNIPLQPGVKGRGSISREKITPRRAKLGTNTLTMLQKRFNGWDDGGTLEHNWPMFMNRHKKEMWVMFQNMSQKEFYPKEKKTTYKKNAGWELGALLRKLDNTKEEERVVRENIESSLAKLNALRKQPQYSSTEPQFEDHEALLQELTENLTEVLRLTKRPGHSWKTKRSLLSGRIAKTK